MLLTEDIQVKMEKNNEYLLDIWKYYHMIILIYLFYHRHPTRMSIIFLRWWLKMLFLSFPMTMKMYNVK